MNEIDEVLKAEKKGRDVIENLIRGKVANYEFTEWKYAVVDLFITGFTDSISAIEIKDREDYSSDTIEKLGGIYIMKHKYDSMMYIQDASGYTPYFIAIFKDKIVIWNLNNVDLNWTKDVLPNTTYGENKGEGIKDFAYLHLKDALRFYETKDFKEYSGRTNG